MVCPKCQSFLLEKDLVKFNVTVSGNLPIEYDAKCPLCDTEIGHMSWGKLTIHPSLREEGAEETQEIQRPELRRVLRTYIPKQPEPEPVEEPEEDKEEVQAEGETGEEIPGGEAESDPYAPYVSEATASEAELCPYCGQPMPHGYQGDY